MSCHTERTLTAVVTTSKVICYACVLILAGKSDKHGKEKPKEKTKVE
jgi:hypothetical protein